MELEIASLPIIFLLSGAAFLAGTIDSIAGGGGLISLPALLLTGISPQLAVGTNKFSAATGCALSVYLFAQAKLIDWKLACKGIAFSLLGAYIGAKAVIALPPDILGKAFTVMLPLIAIFCLKPQKKESAKTTPLKKTETQQNAKKPNNPAVPHTPTAPTPPTEPSIAKSMGPASHSLPLILLICTSIGIYDGFFGPGTGTLMILALFRILKMDLVLASGTAKVFNLSSNVSGLVTFMVGGYVFFSLAIPMAAASIAGNYIGTRLAITKGAGIIRRILPLSLAILFITLFIQYFIN